jgi:hypothetical protein
VLEEQAASTRPQKQAPAEFIELALEFLSNPWNIWKNGGLAVRRVVLRLVFSEPLEWVRKEGYSNAQTITFPFRALAEISGQHGDMVRLEKTRTSTGGYPTATLNAARHLGPAVGLGGRPKPRHGQRAALASR